MISPPDDMIDTYLAGMCARDLDAYPITPDEVQIIIRASTLISRQRDTIRELSEAQAEAREVLRTMIRAAKADAHVANTYGQGGIDRDHAVFCDGGATRLKFAAERLRAALGISPVEYEEMEAEG